MSSSRVGYNCGDDAKGRSVLASVSDNALAGALTGASARALLQPLDVIKIRLQLQAESRDKGKFRGCWHVIATSAREEGLRSLWKGHMSGQYLSVIYGAVNTALYQTLWQQQLQSVFSNENDVGSSKISRSSSSKISGSRALVDLVIGTASAVPAVVLSYPFDLVRTRMVGQFAQSTYAGTFHALFNMWAKEGGPSALFKGMSASLYTVPLYNGLAFCFYNLTKSMLATRPSEEAGRQEAPSDLVSGTVGALAGGLTKTLTFPLDTVKKRLQVQGFGHGRLLLGATPPYQSFVDCFLTILRDEGVFRGLYKGWVPGMAKALPNGAVHFLFLERSLYLVQWYRAAPGDSEPDASDAR